MCRKRLSFIPPSCQVALRQPGEGSCAHSRKWRPVGVPESGKDRRENDEGFALQECQSQLCEIMNANCAFRAQGRYYEASRPVDATQVAAFRCL